MPQSTPSQKLKKLDKLERAIKGDVVSVFEHIDDVESSLNSEVEQIHAKIDNLDIPERLTEQDLVSIIEPLIPEPVKGDKGDSYVLTSQDKEEIVSKIKVPVVEKVIERIEIKREEIDTDKIASDASILAFRAIQDSIPSKESIATEITAQGENVRDSLELLQNENRLDRKAIKGLDDYEEISELARTKSNNGMRGGKGLFSQMNDVSITNPTNGQVPKYNSTTGKWENGNDTGSTSFITLTDTPSSYSGQAGKFPKVKATEDGLEFADVATGGVQSVVAGTNVTVDDTDPANPIVSATGGLNGTLTATRIPHATGTNTLADDENHIWDNTTKTMGVQVDTPKATVHSSATVGQTISDISTASVSLVDETLPSTPTGSITQIAEPTGGSGGSASYVDGGSGSAITASGNSYDFRIYPCLVVGGTYYRSQYYESVSAGTDPNDAQMYNISLSWGTVSISGETVNYFVEYDINGSGSWNPIGVYTSTSETLTGLSGSNPTTSFPTFYTNSVTAPTAFTGGFAYGSDVGSGAFSEIPINVLMEVDSVKNIGGTDYVSGSPTSGSFDDTGMGSYNPEIGWTDNGNATNAVARISQDGGTTWIYQFVGSTTSPYKFTSTSNDTVGEALWGQTYSGTGLTFTFKPYGQGSAPSGLTLYSTVGTDYDTTITDAQNYILKHTFTGNALGKVLDNTSTYGQSYVSGEFYDIGYTTWANGTTVTPNSYGFTGTAQNRDYKLYGYSPSLGIYSVLPLTISTTASGGSKYVSGSFTLPSGVTQVRITRQVNGGGYTHGKLITYGTTFTDDDLDTSWTIGAVTPITPTSIMGVAGRFDKASTSASMTPALSVIHIGGGQGYPHIGFGVATDENSDVTTYVARFAANTSTGYIQAVAGRFDVGTSYGNPPSAMIGVNNVFNNLQSNSVHFNVKGQNDANLINTRSDQDTVGFGQAIGTDRATTVQIQPTRSSDAGLVMIGHSSQSDSSTLMRFQTSAGSYTAEMTVGGWLRTSTGAVGNPSLSCRSDTNTGGYFPTSDVFGMTAGGVEQARFTTTGTSVRLGSASASFAKVGGTISASTTAVGNVGTGEDTLITYTLPAGSMGTNLDRVTGRVSGTFASNANNKRIRLYFGTTAIFDTTALAFNGGNWVADFEVIRVSNTQQKASVTFSSSNALLPVSAKYTLVAMTLTSSQVIRCTGEATSNNDVVQETASIEYKPI